ncbi:universal stress protein [bacterium]|nr:universal stress protein [bacterium]
MVEIKRILVPLDGSSSAETALPMGIALAEKLGSELILLHVLETPTPTFPKEHPEKIIAWVEDARKLALEQAESYLGVLRGKVRDRGISVRALVHSAGAPAEEIMKLAESEDVDLIVMCARGEGAMVRCTLGGIADKVVRHSSCPVLFVRSTGETEPAA